MRSSIEQFINFAIGAIDIYDDEDTPVETIGQRIRRIRIAKGLTQDDLTKLMG